MTERGVPDAVWLRQQYVTRRRNAQQLAADTGWSSQFIRDRLRDAGVPLRPRGAGGAKDVELTRDALAGMLAAGTRAAVIATRTGTAPPACTS